uniref:Exocyst complex subunit Exo70 C-terminal domain-containing protein n=1 Tax=Lactuca sativa TaxID=4236 RepID=A0A9R1WYS5_LACSA|nr:hypothetical protein LSAT_V11C800447850 [Lactuca sativa]
MGNSNRSLGLPSIEERLKRGDLLERGVLSSLKIFNGQFEELHQIQSQWTIPDTELRVRESIRLAIVEVLLPVYRSFIKCFGSSHRGGCYCRYNGTTLSIRIFNSVSSKAMDDPFVVLQTASTPITSPPSVFIDPLETVHKMNKSGSTNVGVSRGVFDFDYIDPLHGFGKPATLSIPHLVTSLKTGLEATQEAALDALFLQRLAWSACPTDVSKSSRAHFGFKKKSSFCCSVYPGH